MMSIAIIKDDFFESHSGSWAGEWISICKENDIDYDFIDWRQQDVIEKALKHDFVLWHFSHYSDAEMKFARSLLYALKIPGIRVFPDESDSVHFDDKIAQTFLLEVIEAPTPKNFVFLSKGAFHEWLEREPSFPIVAKLRCGSGSHNVKLVKSPGEAVTYAQKMFGKGFSSTPRIGFKIGSNLKSSRNLSDIWNRAKRAPEFLFSLAKARELPRESGYVYFQEFIGGAEFDLKVVVVGDKLSFIGRRIRKGDFRASGGGSLFYDRAVMSKAIVDVGFSVADNMNSQCVGMDVVICPTSQQPKIVEISYGFSHTALLAAGGFYDRQARWHDTPLNAPREILCNLIGLKQQ